MNEKPVTLEDRKRLTFRQAEGRETAPAALKWGELDEDLRLELWNAIHAFLVAHHFPGTGIFKGSFARDLATALRRTLRLPIDEALEAFDSFYDASPVLKRIILETDYDEVIDTVQSLARSFSRDVVLPGLLQDVFSEPRCPYQLIGPPPTVVPKGCEIEGHSAVRDLAEISASSARGAFTHLISAAEELNRGEPRDAIRESIHAVESAAIQITGNEKATLPDALKLLEKEKGLHPALREAFSRLYGYTNDEKGIRHALLDSDNKDVGIDEALFMFSACAAFVSFLVRKFPTKDVAT